MGGYQTYSDSKYGFEPSYGNPISPYVSASQIGSALDVRTANQLRETSAKLNTGTSSVEVQMAFPQVAESIPDQHLEEINRLRKLVGGEFTVHGALIDPTGVGEGRWDETRREHAERQMWSSLERAHKVNPDGNVVVTFHTSNGLPEPETRVWDDAKQEDKIVKLSVINDRTGEIAQLPVPKEDFLLSPGKEKSAYKELERINRERWLSDLTQITIDLRRAKEAFGEIQRIKQGEIKEGEKETLEEKEKKAYERYNLYKTKPEVYKAMGEVATEAGEKGVYAIDRATTEAIGQADIWVRDAFNRFKELYSEAYEAAQKHPESTSILPKLQELGSDIRKEIDKDKEYISDYTRLRVFTEKITEGIEQINTLFEKSPPQVYRPLKEFAIDRAAETFSNMAVKAYNKFGDSSPVISIENPPAGSGISRADDMVLLIEESRKMFANKIMKEKGLSQSEADNQAEKLIGATWDVGHINMIRKYGFGDKELVKETETIAPFVKHIHLSDNFGLEHTELPMGMGNVPMKEHLDALRKEHGDKLKKIKQVIETGNWYQHFQTSPYAETLAAFGSPIYSTGLSPAWNQGKDIMGGGYFSGYGMNPDVHHSLYGSGFSGLPVELGGQIAGRSRLSGAPIE